jgi:hypothetical protein
MAWRSWTILALALSLGGCNMVVSDRPLFTKADTHDTPVFKAGLWGAEDPNCVFDSTQPLESWPKCAGGSAIPAGQGILQGTDGTEILIAAGDPLIGQLHFRPGGPIPISYVYGALVPTAWDAQHRVIEVEAWLVQCGPPRPAAANGDQEAGVSLHPMPGLKVKDDNCVADSPLLVRKAAIASRAWQTPQKTHWIRDGDH